MITLYLFLFLALLIWVLARTCNGGNYIIYEDTRTAMPVLEGLGVVFNKQVDSIQFKFCKNCWYNEALHNIHHINRLYGISFGYHNRNSYSIAWKPDINNPALMFLYHYSYSNGIAHYIKFAKVLTRVDYICIINYDYVNNLIMVRINTSENEPLLASTYNYTFPKTRFGYKLKPSFGNKGDVSPYEMALKVKQLK